MEYSYSEKFIWERILRSVFFRIFTSRVPKWFSSYCLLDRTGKWQVKCYLTYYIFTTISSTNWTLITSFQVTILKSYRPKSGLTWNKLNDVMMTPSLLWIHLSYTYTDLQIFSLKLVFIFYLSFPSTKIDE